MVNTRRYGLLLEVRKSMMSMVGHAMSHDDDYCHHVMDIYTVDSTVQ